MVAREPRVAEQTRRAVEPIQNVPRDAQRRQVGVEPFVPSGAEFLACGRVAPEVVKGSLRRLDLFGGSLSLVRVGNHLCARVEFGQHRAFDVLVELVEQNRGGFGAVARGVGFPAAVQILTARPFALRQSMAAASAAHNAAEQLPRLGTVAGLPVGLRGLPDRLADKGRMGVLVDDRIAPVAVLVNVAGSLTPIDAVGEQTANRRRRPLTLGFGRNLVEPSGDLTSALAPPSPLENLGRDRSLIVGDEATGLAFVVAEKAIRGDMDPRSTASRCDVAHDSFSVDRRNSAKTKIVCRNAAPAGVA